MDNNAIRSRWLFLIVMILAGVLVGGVIGSWAARNGYPVFSSGFLAPALASNTVAKPADPSQPLPDSFAPVVGPDLPGVVSVWSTTIVKPSQMNSPFFSLPGFQQFFGNQFRQAQPQKEFALGSGFIVRSNGIILTNNHVVRGATAVHVTLQNEQEYRAKVIGTDPQTDLAVLKIDASGLTALPLGDSSNLRIGDIVFAIGDPLDVGETVTMGIVSAEGRIGVDAESPLAIQNFIQTDAAINHGNSGGPLINTRGQVVGIDTAIATDGGEGNIGIGFAIPIDMAKYVLDQLVAHGKVVRGQLGVLISSLGPDVAKSFGLSTAQGALVEQVTPGSPADKAGIKHGDIILRFNGQPVKSSTELTLAVSGTPPGTRVQLEVFRDGRTIPISVILEQRPSGLNASSEQAIGETSENSPLAGVDVQTLTSDIAGQLNLGEGTRGVVVTSVDTTSPAYGIMQRGDVIEEVNRHAVANVTEFNEAIRAAGHNSVLLFVSRRGNTSYVVIKPGDE